MEYEIGHLMAVLATVINAVGMGVLFYNAMDFKPLKGLITFIIGLGVFMGQIGLHVHLPQSMVALIILAIYFIWRLKNHGEHERAMRDHRERLEREARLKE